MNVLTTGKKLVAIHKAMASHAIQNQYESFMSTGGFRHSDSIESELSEVRHARVVSVV